MTKKDMTNAIITVFEFANNTEYEKKVSKAFGDMGLNKNYRWFSSDRLMRFGHSDLMNIMIKTVEAIY